MTGFTDPLRDPRFPDRPQTPDFWRLSEIGLAHDAAATEGGHSIGSIIGDVIDERSLIYYAEHRLGNAFEMKLDALGPAGKALIMSVYIDAFLKGASFEKAGGHRD